MTETDQVTLHVDDRDITAKEGTSLLQVCLDNDIYIPNLCYLKDSDHPSASCRLCLVEIAGTSQSLHVPSRWQRACGSKRTLLLSGAFSAVPLSCCCRCTRWNAANVQPIKNVNCRKSPNF